MAFSTKLASARFNAGSHNTGRSKASATLCYPNGYAPFSSGVHLANRLSLICRGQTVVAWDPGHPGVPSAEWMALLWSRIAACSEKEAQVALMIGPNSSSGISDCARTLHTIWPTSLFLCHCAYTYHMMAHYLLAICLPYMCLTLYRDRWELVCPLVLAWSSTLGSTCNCTPV